jgi:hypothetical protein
LNWLGIDYTFNFPDGYYSVSDINYFFQNQCILNGLYLTANEKNDNIYFFDLVINSIRYSTSLKNYPIPTREEATALGYSKPENTTWTYPVSAQTPGLTFNQPFANLIGFTFENFPPVTQSNNIQYLLTSTPVISPVDSLILTCNLINSKYRFPNKILFTVPITSALGTIF